MQHVISIITQYCNCLDHCEHDTRTQNASSLSCPQGCSLNPAYGFYVYNWIQNQAFVVKQSFKKWSNKLNFIHKDLFSVFSGWWRGSKGWIVYFENVLANISSIHNYYILLLVNVSSPVKEHWWKTKIAFTICKGMQLWVILVWLFDFIFLYWKENWCLAADIWINSII